MKKWKKQLCNGFSYTYIKYDKFWNISLEFFFEHKLRNWEECVFRIYFLWIYHILPSNAAPLQLFLFSEKIKNEISNLFFLSFQLGNLFLSSKQKIPQKSKLRKYIVPTFKLWKNFMRSIILFMEILKYNWILFE